MCARVLLGLIMSYTVGRNAFDIMMKVTFTLPAKINPPVGRRLRADQELHNNVIDVLQSMKVGWSRDSLSTGQAFTKALTSTLWYLDQHHDTLRERGINLPAPFDKFHGYNDYKRKKEKKPRLSQDGFSHHVQVMSDLLSQPWFCRPMYAELCCKIVTLVEGIKKYGRYLRGNVDRDNETHHSTELVRSPAENVILAIIPAVLEPAINDYSDLLLSLQECPNYQP